MPTTGFSKHKRIACPDVMRIKAGKKFDVTLN